MMDFPDYILFPNVSVKPSPPPSLTSLPAQLHLYRGRMIFSLGRSEANSLKVLNLTEGGCRKGLAPKLNSHCWYDIKLAAAKNPDLPEVKDRHVMSWERKGLVYGA